MSTDLGELSVSRDGGTIVVAVSGEVDESNADEIARALDDLARSDGQGLVIDLSGLDFIGSAGIRALLSVNRTVPASAGLIRIVAPEGSLTRRILLLVEAQRLMALDATLGDAVGALRRTETDPI
jgi:anti-sigma B factor antagonist